jgi:transcriptional regulator with XRE-family HTH domain
MRLKAIHQVRENVKALLRERKENQKDLAFAIKRHPTTINKFLQGTREIQLEDLDGIADFFGIQPYELFQPGGYALSERRSGLERRTGKERRVGEARRVMLHIATEVFRISRKGQPHHAQTTPADALPDPLQTLVEEFEQRAAIILSTDAAARRQVAVDRVSVPQASPLVRPARRPRARKA